MRTIAYIATIILTLTLFYGCQSEQGRTQPWIGQHYINLWGSWGDPQEIIKDESGGKTLIYREKPDKSPYVRFAVNYGHYIKETVFVVNLSGIIISENVDIKWLR